MSRRIAFAAVAMALVSGGLVALVLVVGSPRPVEVRRVDVGPVEPGVLSATHTTTVAVALPTTSVIVQPAAQPPPSPRVVSPSPASSKGCEHGTGACPPARLADVVERLCSSGPIRVEVRVHLPGLDVRACG